MHALHNFAVPTVAHQLGLHTTAASSCKFYDMTTNTCTYNKLKHVQLKRASSLCGTRRHVILHAETTEHVHILADHVTLSINQLERVVSSPAASLARAPRRRHLE